MILLEESVNFDETRYFGGYGGGGEGCSQKRMW